jgi:hypothetical protein
MTGQRTVYGHAQRLRRPGKNTGFVISVAGSSIGTHCHGRCEGDPDN